MENLEIYNKVRSVPPEAKKPITGGRLNGKTDINPMWRIKTLTEQFGLVGFGWKYEIVEKSIEKGADEEVSSFVQINLYIKQGNEWSAPIPGVGGSAFVCKESKGLYTSDECYKMALTDAISVACKAIGIGADVYWEKDKTKYDGSKNKTVAPNETTPPPEPAGKDSRRVVPIDKLLKEPFLQSLHDLDKKNKDEGKRSSIHSILERNYVLSKEEITSICKALGEFEKRTNQVLL